MLYTYTYIYVCLCVNLCIFRLFTAAFSGRNERNIDEKLRADNCHHRGEHCSCSSHANR